MFSSVVKTLFVFEDLETGRGLAIVVGGRSSLPAIREGVLERDWQWGRILTWIYLRCLCGCVCAAL